jgi:ABC-2 type transport system permease protein
MSRLLWSLRRELWENRSIYLGPLAVAGVALAGFSIALVRLPGRISSPGLDPASIREIIQQPYVIVALMLMLIELLVAIVYSLDALYGERRDRSILFWKSLPVSDLTTVLAKASIPILVLPLLTFVVTMATQAIMLVASSAVLAASGVSAGQLWTQVPLFDLARINLVHLVTFHGVWWAPLYAWLLLVSAWATRVPVLWAALPLVAIGIVERIAFNSTHFAILLQDYFLGGPLSSGDNPTMTLDMLAPHPLRHYLLRPELWGGLALTAVLLGAAVRLRHVRSAM